MLALPLSPLSMVPVTSMTLPGRAPNVVMKSEIVLADKEVEAEIMAVVNAEPSQTKSAAMCSQMASKNIDRIRMEEEDGGMNPFGPPLTMATGMGWDTSTEPKNEADMQALAVKQNPVVGFYDPLGIVTEDTSPETIGWFRHAEIKHGRVAMAGFVGYCVHANGIHFPWKIPGDELCVPGVSPPALWQGIPDEAKWQILLTIGLFEFYSEAAMAKVPGQGGHYMRGGKPGLFPPFNLPKGVKGQSGIGTLEDAEGGPLLPHPVPLNLYDPFGFNKNKSDEWKAQKLKTEINNGRLAMIGLMSLLSEGAV